MSAAQMYDKLTASQCEQIAERFLTIMHERAMGTRSRASALSAMATLWLKIVGWTS